VVAVGAMLGSLLGMAPGVLAGSVIGVTTTNQEINADGFCSLQEAIYAANLDDNVAPDPTSPGDFVDTACVGGDGADIIELPPMGVFTFADPISDADNYVGPSATPIITSEIIIEGRGARLQRHALGRLTRAFVVGFGGNLDLREVHIKGFGIHGGNGADGGGGGMGAGGAIYVDLGDLRIQWSTFEANVAEGGNGSFQDTVGGGGGGGLSGNGGASEESGGGGGGGGASGSGGEGFFDAGGGGGGRVTSGQTPEPGEPCGGRGGEDPNSTGADGGDDASCAGGGGGGGTDRVTPFDPFCGGAGGAGKYAGGGGGGGESGDGGSGGFGGGGGAGGGDGGFGGGGGSAGFSCFGSGRGQGGTFAGDGGEPFGDGGGGGAGLGGAVFGYLSDITISNSTFAFNGAKRGVNGGGDSRDGRGAGGAVFVVGGDLAIESSTFAGNETVTVTGGGGGAIVVYDPEGNEEASLQLRNSIVAGNGAAECYTRNGVTTTGSDGNVITDSSANNLDDPACPGVTSSDDPQLGPLLLNAPGRTPTLAIPVTSPAADAAVGGTSPLDDQRGVARPQGSGPDIGAYEVRASESGNLAPTTTITLSPGAPGGANGWYVSAVGVTIGGTDPDGTIDQTRCALDPASAPATFDDLPVAACSVSSVTTDGQHAIYAASRDDGGAVSPVVSAALKIDQTPPTLSPTISSTTVQVGQTGVTASPNASDATSGVGSSSCGAIDTSTPGDNTVTCTATDNAGNTASATVHFVVEYQILGFFSPVPLSKWMVGQMVPVKIALGNADGTRISDAEATELARSCRVQFSVEGAQTKNAQCMKYDAKNDQFIFNWKLAKQGDGLATITVTVSYPGTTWTTQLSAEVTITP
jgi:hypothetical protein